VTTTEHCVKVYVNQSDHGLGARFERKIIRRDREYHTRIVVKGHMNIKGIH